jgi:hypothetical protein
VQGIVPLLICIRSLYYFSSILMHSEWEKLKESTFKVILVVGPSLENWILKPFKDFLRHQTNFNGIKIFLDLA